MRFGPGAEGAAQPGGAELQPAVEPLAEPVEVVGGEQGVELGPGVGVRVLVAPRPRPGAEAASAIGHRRPTTSASSSPIGLGGGRARPPARRRGRGGSSPSPAARLVTSETAEHLGADVAGGDDLVHRRHADEVGAEDLRACGSRPASRSCGPGSPA